MGLLYRVGRFLQFLGLFILPVAIMGEVTNNMDLKDSLSFSAVGVLAFMLGWFLQQLDKPK